MKVVFDLDDALWLVEHLPAIKDTDNKPRFLRVMAVLHEAMDGDFDAALPSGGNIRILSYKFKVEAVKFVRSITGMTLKEALHSVANPYAVYSVPPDVDVHAMATQMNILFEWVNVTAEGGVVPVVPTTWTDALPSSAQKALED